MVLTVLCCAGTVPQSESHWFWGCRHEPACFSGRGTSLQCVTPPPSSAASATVPDDNSDPMDMDSELTYNEASVINSDGIMYNPFDRPPRRLWRLFPETGPVALVGRDLPDRRLCKSARWCFLMLFRRPELLTCAHVCMLVWLRAGEASTSFICPLRVIMSVTRSLSQGSHAASTLASNWSEWSSVQGPTDETSARGSSDCPCRAIRLVNFPRDGHAPSDCASGSVSFPPKSSGAARSGIDDAMGPWLCPQEGDVLLVESHPLSWDTLKWWLMAC